MRAAARTVRRVDGGGGTSATTTRSTSSPEHSALTHGEGVDGGVACYVQTSLGDDGSAEAAHRADLTACEDGLAGVGRDGMQEPVALRPYGPDDALRARAGGGDDGRASPSHPGA